MPANDGTTDTWFGLVERRGDHVVLSIASAELRPQRSHSGPAKMGARQWLCTLSDNGPLAQLRRFTSRGEEGQGGYGSRTYPRDSFPIHADHTCPKSSFWGNKFMSGGLCRSSVVLRPILTLQAASVGVTPNAATASQQTQQIEASHHYDDSPSEAAAL
jgi:hypothetical protein